MRYLLILILCSPFAAFAGVLAWLRWNQESFLFRPESLPRDFLFKAGDPPGEERWLEVDGKRVHSYFFKPPSPQNLILYFHGNAGNLESWNEVARELSLKTASSVWVMDYPGYGWSEGRISSEKQLHDISAAFLSRALAEANANRLRFFLYGRSIGTGLATRLAAGRADVAGLILESPYTSLARVVKGVMWWVPLFLLRYPLRTDEILPKVVCPTLILHGTGDQTIPVEHSRDLKAIRPVGTELVIVDGAAHNDLSSYDAYWRAVGSFLRQP